MYNSLSEECSLLWLISLYGYIQLAPVGKCIVCRRRLVSNNCTKVKYYAEGGVSYADKVTLRCVDCTLFYNLTQYGNKSDLGFRHYPEVRYCRRYNIVNKEVGLAEHHRSVAECCVKWQNYLINPQAYRTQFIINSSGTRLETSRIANKGLVVLLIYFMSLFSNPNPNPTSTPKQCIAGNQNLWNYKMPLL